MFDTTATLTLTVGGFEVYGSLVSADEHDIDPIPGLTPGLEWGQSRFLWFRGDWRRDAILTLTLPLSLGGARVWLCDEWWRDGY